MKTLFVYFICCIALNACSKGTAEKDTEFPVITLNTPLDNQVFTDGQSIPMSGSITDNKSIAEIHIHVTNSNTGTLLMDVHLYPNGATAVFNQSITATTGVNYKIEIIAIDRAVNKTTSVVNVSCN